MSAARAHASVRGAVAREADITWRFVRRDLLALVLPSALFTLAALRARGHATAAEVAEGCARSVAYGSLAVYSSDVANQIAGVDEDRRNKPDRPIAAGLLTVGEAWARYALSVALLTAAGAALGVLPWALAFSALVAVYNFGGGDRHWFTKNVVLCSLAIFVTAAAGWRIAAPLDGAGWRLASAAGGVWALTIHVADLRDVAGDRAAGRRTLPLLVGDRAARALAAASVLLTLPLLHALVFAPAGGGAPGRALEAAVAAGALLLAARFALRTTARDHRLTYELYLAWFGLTLVAALALA